MSNLTRRTFLKGTAAFLAVGMSSSSAITRAKFASDPFKLGVASGSPLPDAVIIWTRLAPDPVAGGGLDPVPLSVKWEVAADENFKKIVQQGKTTALPEFAHSVHVDVRGLKPAHQYWYRFFAGDAVSQSGRMQTAPSLDATNKELKFAFASCQQYEQGFYAAHRHMAEEDIDLVFFLGDYIYEHSWGSNLVRQHEAQEPHTLAEYRNRYALYKTDPDLQLCHQRFPWIVTWDDHEVDNDYANDRSEDGDHEFLKRRAAAYQAFYEHMPLRAVCQPNSPDLHIYGTFDFGQLARFHVLDDRQYRDYQFSTMPNQCAGSSLIKKCSALHDENRSMLGRQQEKWLAGSLKHSNAIWDVIVQQTLMAQAMRPDETFWTDGWDGYPAARRRLLESTVRGQSHNTIVIGGDVHASAVTDLKLDFDNPHAPTVATEFCSTSITSAEPWAASKTWSANNPHIRFASGEKRGYTKVALNQDHAKVTLRAVANEKDPKSIIFSMAEFTVKKACPGAQQDA